MAAALFHFVSLAETLNAAHHRLPVETHEVQSLLALILVYVAQGLPLVKQVDRKLALDIELFSQGGMEILNAIERQDYAVLGCRPAISKARKLALVARAALRHPITPKSGVLGTPRKLR